MINPYSGIDLGTVERIQSVSHQHLSHSSDELTRSNFNTIYGTGVRHFAISRYRPSLITYPFDYTDGSFVYVNNPFDSTDSPETLKENYSCTVDIEDDVIGSPNAEHLYPLLLWNGSWNKWNSVHMNGLGSTFESGLKPVESTGYGNEGLGISYSKAIDAILKKLQYPDGGGVIINHPNWTNNNKHFDFDVPRFIEDCLDLDQRVLGTDIISGGKQTALEYQTGVIDSILATGRRCWIFCQGDWNLKRGRNELLIPSGLSGAEKEHECLKAYRNGAFFGRYGNSNLSITSIGYSDGTFAMTADNADGIAVIVDGVETDYDSDSVSVSVPSTAKYVRAYAYISRDDDPDWEYDNDDVYKDVVFTNPIMINPVNYPYVPAYDVAHSKSKRRFWMYG